VEPKLETFEQAFVKLNAEVTEAFNGGAVKACAGFFISLSPSLYAPR
jgi:hypothetical protein